MTFFFELFFSLSDKCNFWVCVKDGGNAVIIDMSFSVFNDFNNSYTFFFCLMCEHCASDNISDSVDMGDCGLKLFIDFNSSGFILLDSNCLKIKILSVWYSSNCNHAIFCFKSWSLFSFFLSSCDFNTTINHFMCIHFSVCEDLHSLLFESS